MSWLLRPSERLKGATTPDDLAGVQDNIDHASGVGLAADTSERVWKVSEFSVFNELQKPIAVVSPGLYHKQSRCAKPKGSPLVMFQNLECQRRFGIPRSQSACCT
ncbi:hypothetical protein ABBQ38_006095 [Trebouxia sp. C0009 RCD-2024]